MNLSATDRAYLATIVPFEPKGIAPEDLDDVLDAWFAQDHYDDNPVFTWNDNESHDQ